MCAKLLQWLVPISAVLAVAPSARADLALGTHSRLASGLSAGPAKPLSAEQVPPRLVDELLGGVWPWLEEPLPLVPSAVPAVGSAPCTGEVLTLPPGPDSATLLLWAFGGFGVWHLGRSARKLHLGMLPEWYHTGGPAQVGHATPLDLEFSRLALPACRFELPSGQADERPAPEWRLRLERIRQRDLKHFFPSADPRGPPLPFS